MTGSKSLGDLLGFSNVFSGCFKSRLVRLDLVSRLDLPTSGILPLATSQVAAQLLRCQFTASLVKKENLRLCFFFVFFLVRECAWE